MAIQAIDIVTAFCILFATASAREVRPSDHGLGYTPPAGDAPPPAMMSFFGAAASNSTSPPPRPFLNPSNSTDDSWMSSGGGRDKARVREILLVASLVCGVTGVGLLLGSGMFFVFKLRRERRRSTPKSTTRPVSSAVAGGGAADNYL